MKDVFTVLTDIDSTIGSRLSNAITTKVVLTLEKAWSYIISHALREKLQDNAIDKETFAQSTVRY